MDANRLVLLDRGENGDNGHSEDSDIPVLVITSFQAANGGASSIALHLAVG